MFSEEVLVDPSRRVLVALSPGNILEDTVGLDPVQK